MRPLSARIRSPLSPKGKARDNAGAAEQAKPPQRGKQEIMPAQRNRRSLPEGESREMAVLNKHCTEIRDKIRTKREKYGNRETETERRTDDGNNKAGTTF